MLFRIAFMRSRNQRSAGSGNKGAAAVHAAVAHATSRRRELSARRRPVTKPQTENGDNKKQQNGETPRAKTAGSRQNAGCQKGSSLSPAVRETVMRRYQPAQRPKFFKPPAVVVRVGGEAPEARHAPAGEATPCEGTSQRQEAVVCLRYIGSGGWQEGVRKRRCREAQAGECRAASERENRYMHAPRRLSIAGSYVSRRGRRRRKRQGNRISARRNVVRSRMVKAGDIVQAAIATHGNVPHTPAYRLMPASLSSSSIPAFPYVRCHRSGFCATSNRPEECSNHSKHSG